MKLFFYILLFETVDSLFITAVFKKRKKNVKNSGFGS